MNASLPERLLILILRVSGAAMIVAVVPTLMPREWMAMIHEWLGIGRLPDAPIVEYLARSLSGFYAIHGGLFWLFAGDARRYAPAIRYCGWTALLGGLLLLALDLRLGLPLFWVLGEGPLVVLMAVAILVCVAKTPEEKD